MGRKTLNIEEDTYERLESRKSEGQSFDGLLREMLDDEYTSTQRPGWVDDLAAELPRRTADAVEDRLR